MATMTRESLLARRSRKTVAVADPETGDTFTVQVLSARQRDEFDASLQVGGVGKERTMNLTNLRGRLLALCVVDPELSADEWGDEPTDLVSVLFAAAQKLNGMLPDAVDVAEKNSGSAPSAASYSV